MNSPTFTILQIYESGRLPLYHFDVYRIGDPEELNSEVRKAKARLKKAAADLDEYKEMIGRS